jgi:hypothetical protein
MLINSLMHSQLRSICWESIEKTTLPYDLNEIIEQGFVELYGCFLSKNLLTYCNSVTPDVFEDEIAFECFVNSIHVEDYVSENHFQYSIVFCNSMIRKWSKSHAGYLNVIISLDDETLLPTIKFHLKRKGVSWLDEDNLDSSIQAVLVTTDEINKAKLSSLLIK